MMWHGSILSCCTRSGSNSLFLAFTTNQVFSQKGEISSSVSCVNYGKFGGLGFLTKLCLGSFLGALGRKLTIYGVRLLPPNMGRLVEVGALGLLEGHMAVGVGRTLGNV